VDPRLAAHLELQALPDEEAVRRLYALALRREPDSEGLERALTRLADGSLSRAALLAELVSGPEFEHVRALDDAVAEAAAARALGTPLREIQAPPGDERPVEVAWALSRVRTDARVLDLGYAFAEAAYLAGLLAAEPREMTGVDLAEREVPGMRTAAADIRELPFADGSFDLAICISTLEHVGRDTGRYGIDAETDDNGIGAALAELRRVLARDGRLLLTVPTGAREDHGWFVQLEPAEWRGLFADAKLEVAEEELYELRAEGWRATRDPGPAAYGKRGPGASAILCASLRPARGFLRRLHR
jgi:SAM-dependent methyltransferase